MTALVEHGASCRIGATKELDDHLIGSIAPHRSWRDCGPLVALGAIIAACVESFGRDEALTCHNDDWSFERA